MRKAPRFWRDVKLLLTLAPTAVLVVPGMTLLLLGLSLMVLQLFAPGSGPLQLGSVRMDFHWSIVGGFLALVGYQLLIFHFLAKVYLVSQGQEHEDRLLAMALRVFTLERAIGIAAIAIIAGLVLDGTVTIKWLTSGFGPLVEANTRRFILGSTLLVLGIQTALNAFFFSTVRDAWRVSQDQPIR
jgi:hypothetical protein